MPGKRWGRWQLEGDHLVYCPSPGAVDPGYELDTSRLDGVVTIHECVEHLLEKNWVQPDDVTNLVEACESILRYRFMDEHHLSIPQAMSWLEYQAALADEWPAFLQTADPQSEAAFQRFLEQHPILLPGPFGTTRGMYHGPIHRAVYTQPELPGFRAKRPDFLLFEQDSGTVYAVLVEIEAPGKPWCTSRGSPSALLTQAIDQLRDWKAWFSKPTNVLAFQELYGISNEIGDRRFVQHYVLIYGRREEANRLRSFIAKRHDLASTDEFFMTYDRLRPAGSAEITVKLDRSGPDTRLRVVSLPPTFKLDRDDARWFTSLIGCEEAIRSIPFVSEPRKAALLERLLIAREYVQRSVQRRDSPHSRWL